MWWFSYAVLCQFDRHCYISPSRQFARVNGTRISPAWLYVNRYICRNRRHLVSDYRATVWPQLEVPPPPPLHQERSTSMLSLWNSFYSLGVKCQNWRVNFLAGWAPSDGVWCVAFTCCLASIEDSYPHPRPHTHRGSTTVHTRSDLSGEISYTTTCKNELDKNIQ